MKCPYCHNELEKGKILGTHLDGFVWLPEDVKRRHYNTPQYLEKNGGFEIKNPSWHAELETFICRECRKGIISF